MQHFGVKVSIIEPGFFKTGVTRLDLIEADLKRLWDRLPQDVKDSYGENYLDECEYSVCVCVCVCEIGRASCRERV